MSILLPLRRWVANTLLRLPTPAPLPTEEDFETIYAQCRPYTMTSRERMYALYKATRYVINAGVPGDFVECGVWRGGSTMLIALTLKELGETGRRIYLYDTYEGMTPPEERDYRISDQEPAGAQWDDSGEPSWCYSSLEEVRENMRSTGYPEDRFVFVKGKVEETIPGMVPKRISLLRLDTDWYQSTRHELEHLYPLVSKEGVMVIDDYGYWAGQREAVDEYFADTPLLLNAVDHSCRVAVKTRTTPK